MDWPPRSPNVIIDNIETARDPLDREWNKNEANIQTRDLKALQEAWRTITDDYLMKLQESCLRVCVEEKRWQHQIMTFKLIRSKVCFCLIY